MAKIQSIRERTLPAVEQLIRSNYTAAAYVHAYRLIGDAERSIPGEPQLEKLWRATARTVDIVTEPPGAELPVTGFGTPDTLHFGPSPVRTSVFHVSFLAGARGRTATRRSKDFSMGRGIPFTSCSIESTACPREWSAPQVARSTSA